MKYNIWTFIGLALILTGCGPSTSGSKSSVQEPSDPRGILSRKDLAGQEKVDYTTAVRCLWLSRDFMSDSDHKVADAAMRVQTKARFFANQHATEAGKGPAQVEQDLIDMTAVVSKTAPPSAPSCLNYMFGGQSVEQDAKCEADTKAEGEKRAAEIAAGVRPDEGKIIRNEFLTVCIPLLGE